MLDEPLRVLVASFRTRASAAYASGQRFDRRKHRDVIAQYNTEGRTLDQCARELEKLLDGYESGQDERDPGTS